MRGLRQTLTLAFGGLLALLLVVGVTSILLLGRYSSTLETIFRENYDTVLYCENMKDALTVLDGIAARSAWGQATPDHVHDDAVAKFEANLRAELANLTLPGEDEAAALLEQQWRVYKTDLMRHRARAGGDRQAFYRDSLLGQAENAKCTVQHIIDINLANMVSVDGRARAEAVAARNAMVALMAFGALFAIGFTGVLARAVLKPVQTLTASVREIERGNLDLEVPVTSRDELGQLAEAFNAMAARLREFRSSDRARLERTQRTTQLAVDSFPDAVAVVGLDGRVELANEAARRVFGLLPGHPVSESPSPALASTLTSIVEGTLASRRPFEPDGYEAAIERFDKQKRHFQPKAVPILAEDGSLIGITLVLSDVTNLRRLDEMKTALVSTVSHELKTPLTSIRMATHLLLEGQVGPLTAKQSELLTAAREDGDRLYSIIDNLLDMGRIEAGSHGMSLRSADIAETIERAAQVHAGLFRDKGVELVADVGNGLAPVLADQDRLRHVFANLLDNALRHTPAGGRVVLGAKRHGAFVEVSVSDSGSGISAEHLPHVFERFYRATDGADQGGAGLGLAIVKEIVEAHGGSVEVDSREGDGSTFRFTLRVAAVAHGSDSTLS